MEKIDLKTIIALCKANLSEYYECSDMRSKRYKKAFKAMENCSCLDELVDNLYEGQEIDDTKEAVYKFILDSIIKER